MISKKLKPALLRPANILFAFCSAWSIVGPFSMVALYLDTDGVSRFIAPVLFAVGFVIGYVSSAVNCYRTSITLSDFSNLAKETKEATRRHIEKYHDRAVMEFVRDIRNDAIELAKTSGHYYTNYVLRYCEHATKFGLFFKDLEEDIYKALESCGYTMSVDLSTYTYNDKPDKAWRIQWSDVKKDAKAG